MLAFLLRDSIGHGRRDVRSSSRSTTVGLWWSMDPENWDPDGWLLNPWQHHSAVVPSQVDPNLKAMYTETLSLAYEREVGRRASVTLTYVDKTDQRHLRGHLRRQLAHPDARAAAATTTSWPTCPNSSRDYSGLHHRVQHPDLQLDDPQHLLHVLRLQGQPGVRPESGIRLSMNIRRTTTTATVISPTTASTASSSTVSSPSRATGRSVLTPSGPQPSPGSRMPTAATAARITTA